jgi:hypothetical protein
LLLVRFYPWLLGDPENFIPANPYSTWVIFFICLCYSSKNP